MDAEALGLLVADYHAKQGERDKHREFLVTQGELLEELGRALRFHGSPRRVTATDTELVLAPPVTRVGEARKGPQTFSGADLAQIISAMNEIERLGRALASYDEDLREAGYPGLGLTRRSS